VVIRASSAPAGATKPDTPIIMVAKNNPVMFMSAPPTKAPYSPFQDIGFQWISVDNRSGGGAAQNVT
jgi:hypothetical protein